MNNDELLRMLGYGSLVDQINSGICPFCAQTVNIYALDTDEAREEYMTTGMCGNCYELFGKTLRGQWDCLSHEEQEKVVYAIIDMRITRDEARRKCGE